MISGGGVLWRDSAKCPNLRRCYHRDTFPHSRRPLLLLYFVIAYPVIYFADIWAEAIETTKTVVSIQSSAMMAVTNIR